MKDIGPSKTTDFDDVYVTILLTESTTSFLNLNLPHVECMHPDNSKIFIISPEKYKLIYKKAAPLCVNSDENVNSQGSIPISVAHNPSSANADASSLDQNRSLPTSKSDSVLYKTHLQMASDVCLFKSNFSSRSSSMYEGCDSDEILQDRKSAEFKALKIKPLPLLAVRTTAHSNKLNSYSTDIYVSLLDSSINSSEHICRICHGGESIDDLLTPCRCRGTVALVHLKCLERWLKDSHHSSCELCQHHFKIVRKPRYGIMGSIPAYLRENGPQFREILIDLFAFIVYTPSAVASTYMLMVLCETLVKSNVTTTGTFPSHLLAFSAIFGMAAIDFTYSSWLLYTCQRHLESWRSWYHSNTTLKVVLSPIKLRPHKKIRQQEYKVLNE
ncbi:unnamed protein product [Phyllotreta striolata]|uniref:RING-CH-type domain-containing protein n=1 Tax=Phyllotreta striolata TaxID=444603 RepID=A0A9N9TX95_PHYSR|nr:unnamed protein product [Phyllotreta striolata]